MMSLTRIDEMGDNKAHSVSEQNNRTTKNKSIRSIVCDYAERTTLHGFRYLILGGSLIRRFVWLCFITCSCLYFAYNGFRLCTKFFQHTTMTKNEIITQQRMLFPAVTICNYNAIQESKREELVKLIRQKFNKLHGSTSSRIEETHFINFLNITEYKDIDIELMYQNCGHTMDKEGMLVRCWWKGKSCSAKDFRSSAQNLGLCHTFNSGKLTRNYKIFFITILNLESW